MDQVAAHVHARNMLSVIAEAAGLQAIARHDETGWIVLATSPASGETWRILALDLNEAVCELAERVGFDLDA